MSENLCPRCHLELKPSRSPGGVHFSCPSCTGRAVSLPLLRKELDADFVNNVWQAVRDAPAVNHHDALDCPYCSGKMHPAGISAAGDAFQLDVCRHCHVLWMDPGEIEKLPGHGNPQRRPGQAPETRALPMEARAILAEHIVRNIRDEANGKPLSTEMPSDPWKAVVTFLGLPVEDDAPALDMRPLATWSIALACVLVFVLDAFFLQGALGESFAFIPDQASRHGGITFLTAFFLHGGLLHLLGNMWFLLMLGDNCESWLGRPRYLLLLAAGSVAGCLAHGWWDARGHLPLVGASAGISALITFYGMTSPRTGIFVGLRFGFIPFWFRLAAVWAMVFWLASQVFLLMLQIAGMSDISALGHLGGAAVGLLAFWTRAWILPGGGNGGFPRWRSKGDFSDPGAMLRDLQRGKDRGKRLR